MNWSEWNKDTETLALYRNNKPVWWVKCKILVCHWFCQSTSELLVSGSSGVIFSLCPSEIVAYLEPRLAGGGGVGAQAETSECICRGSDLTGGTVVWHKGTVGQEGKVGGKKTRQHTRQQQRAGEWPCSWQHRDVFRDGGKAWAGLLLKQRDMMAGRHMGRRGGGGG